MKRRTTPKNVSMRLLMYAVRRNEPVAGSGGGFAKAVLSVF